MNVRTALKQLVKGIFTILSVPFYILFYLLDFISSADNAFQTCSQLISLVPGKSGKYLRAAFYSWICPDTSRDVSIGFLTVFSHRDTTIGQGVYIGPQCNIGKCSIGKNTLIGSGVHILSGKNQHRFDQLDIPIQKQGGNFEKIQIGNDCWIGNLSAIMSNVGDQSVIATSSVVNKPIPSRVVAAGHPAKVIRER